MSGRIDLHNERHCERCIHHIQGYCDSWECHEESIDEHDERLKAEEEKETLRRELE